MNDTYIVADKATPATQIKFWPMCIAVFGSFLNTANLCVATARKTLTLQAPSVYD